MISQELINGVIQHLKQGDAKEVIRTHVLDAGYSERDFNEAYTKAMTIQQAFVGAAPAQPTPPVATPQPANAPSASTGYGNQPDVTSHTAPPTHTATSDTSAVPAATSVLPDHYQAAQPKPQPPAATTASSQPATQSNALKYALSALAGVFLLVLLAGGAALATGLVPTPAFLQSVLGKPPYQEDQLLEGIVMGLQKIDRGTVSVGLDMTAQPLDDDVYLLPEQLSDAFGSSFSFLSQIPRDFSAGGSLSGTFDTEAANRALAGQIVGYYETPDLTINADVEYRVSDSIGAYIRINRLPSLFGFDLSPVRGQWLQIAESDADTSGTFSSLEESQAENLAYGKVLFETAREYDVLVSTTAPEAETVNGVNAYKYTVQLNEETFADFLQALQRQYDEIAAQERVAPSPFRRPSHPMSNLSEEEIAVLGSAAYVEYLNAHYTYNLWVRSDGVPVQFAATIRIAIDDDADLRGEARKASYLFRINNNVTNAELYYTNAGSYTGLCENERSISYQVERGNGYGCQASTEAYVLVLRDDDMDFSACVDSGGYRGQGTMDETNYRCIPTTVTEEPPEADRQLQSVVTVALSNINESISVTVPEDALTMEEARERLPMFDMLFPTSRQPENFNNIPRVPRAE